MPQLVVAGFDRVAPCCFVDSRKTCLRATKFWNLKAARAEILYMFLHQVLWDVATIHAAFTSGVPSRRRGFVAIFVCHKCHPNTNGPLAFPRACLSFPSRGSETTGEEAAGDVRHVRSVFIGYTRCCKVSPLLCPDLACTFLSRLEM